MSRADPQMVIRVPTDIKERLRSSAGRNRRSMNSEILFQLDRALAAEKENGPAEAATSEPSLNTINP